MLLIRILFSLCFSFSVNIHIYWKSKFTSWSFINFFVLFFIFLTIVKRNIFIFFIFLFIFRLTEYIIKPTHRFTTFHLQKMVFLQYNYHLIPLYLFLSEHLLNLALSKNKP